MKPVTASCLAALGLALVHPGRDWRFAFAVGVGVAALAVFGLGVVLFNLELGIDRWLAPGDASFRTAATSYRVINAATLGIALAGSSLALSRFERFRLAAPLLAGPAGAIPLFGLLVSPPR